MNLTYLSSAREASRKRVKNEERIKFMFVYMPIRSCVYLADDFVEESSALEAFFEHTSYAELPTACTVRYRWFDNYQFGTF